MREMSKDEINATLMDETARLRQELSEARAEIARVRREAIEECAALIENRAWETTVYEETTGDMLENVVAAIRALAKQEEGK